MRLGGLTTVMRMGEERCVGEHARSFLNAGSGMVMAIQQWTRRTHTGKVGGRMTLRIPGLFRLADMPRPGTSKWNRERLE